MVGLGSQTQLGIGIAIQLQDKFSATADRVYGKLRQLKSQTNSTINSALTSYRNQQAQMAAAGAAITYGFFNMARNASQFGHKINQVDIVSERKLGKTKKQLADMALQMSKDFATPSIDVGESLFENVKAGVTQGIEEINRYQLAVSKATDENAAVVSKYLLGTANSMGIPYQNFARVANSMTAAANASMASVESIGETMKQTGFTFKQFNIPLEESLALIAKLSQSNITGSMAGTYLKNMVTYLGAASAAPTKKQQAAWQTLGVDPGQVSALLNQGKVFDVIKQFDAATQNLDPSRRLSALKDILNIRGAMGMMGAMFGYDQNGNAIQGQKTITSLLQEIRDGVKSDIAMRQAKEMMNDPYSQMQRVQVAWQNFQIKFIGSAAPMLMKVLKGAEWFIDKVLTPIAQSPVGTIFGSILMVGVPLVTTLFAFRAATLTAIIALRGFAAGAQSLGFKNMVGLGLGSIGTRNPTLVQGMGAMGISEMIARNKYGNPYVKGGTPGLSYLGRNYLPGQALPRGFQPFLATPLAQAAMTPLRSGPAANMPFMGFGGLAAQETRNSRIWGRMGTGIGNMTRGLSTIGSRLIPIAGQAVMIGSLVMIGREMLATAKQERADRLNKEREQALLDKQFIDSFNQNLANFWGGGGNRSLAQAGGMWYTQSQQNAQKTQLNIYVDGEKKMNNMLDELAKGLARKTTIQI